LYTAAYEIPEQINVWRNWEDETIGTLLDDVEDYQYEVVLDREEFDADDIRGWRTQGLQSSFSALIQAIDRVQPLLAAKQASARR
jgi:hypothetical protein